MKYQHVGGGEDVVSAIHLPPLPVKAVPQLQLKKSDKLSSASNLLLLEGRSESQKLTRTPAGERRVRTSTAQHTGESQTLFHSVASLSEGGH